MALNKLSIVYNKGKKELNSIISKSNNDIIKIIKYKSNLMENRQEIEESEAKLDKINKKIKDFNFEEELKNQMNDSSKFSTHSVLLQIYKPKYLKFISEKNKTTNHELIKSSFIALPMIVNNKVNALNFINEFNLENGLSYEENINYETSLIKMSGFLICNEPEEFQLRIETNSE